jgi:hypothetical protein
MLPQCGCPPETFWTLLHDKAHWEFELFLIAIFDGIVGAVLYPWVRKHWNHHIARDKRESEGEKYFG